jgi:hypothetical protein
MYPCCKFIQINTGLINRTLKKVTTTWVEADGDLGNGVIRVLNNTELSHVRGGLLSVHYYAV